MGSTRHKPSSPTLEMAICNSWWDKACSNWGVMSWEHRYYCVETVELLVSACTIVLTKAGRGWLLSKELCSSLLKCQILPADNGGGLFCYVSQGWIHEKPSSSSEGSVLNKFCLKTHLQDWAEMGRVLQIQLLFSHSGSTGCLTLSLAGLREISLRRLM